LRREASRFSDPGLEQLLRRAEAYARTIPPPDPGALLDVPFICPRLRIDEHTVRTVSTVMRFDTAIDVTASELRVELMFPQTTTVTAISGRSPGTRTPDRMLAEFQYEGGEAIRIVFGELDVRHRAHDEGGLN
jgi:hypothetical protein